MWKGNISATLLWTTYGASQFSMYGVVKSVLYDTIDPAERAARDQPSEAARSVIDGIAGAGELIV